MKTILALALLLALLAQLSSGANNVTVKGNADVNVAPGTNPNVTIVNQANPNEAAAPENKPDVVVQEKKEVVVVPTTPAKKTEVNIPGFDAAFAAMGILAALRALKRKR